MSQPLPMNPFDNSIQSIQSFIRFHQASAQLGLSLLARNQAPNPFLPKRSNLILSGDSKGVPMIPPVYQNAMKPTFPQNIYEQKVNQPQLPFSFPSYFDNMRTKLEPSFKTEVKVEDSHHSDVTKDSESVKKEEEELEKPPMIEEKYSSPKILVESKKITKVPKTKKSPPKQQIKEDQEEENLSEGKEAEPKWRRKCWSHTEDSQLLELIETHGKKWSKIASAMGGRTGKQVRDRYLNVLIPDIKRTNWTDLEDRLIWALYFQLGTKWCKIAEHLPGRTEGQVKNRFYTYLKKKSDKEEEEMRANLVIKPDMQDLLYQAQVQRIKKEEDASRGILPKIEQ